MPLPLIPLAIGGASIAASLLGNRKQKLPKFDIAAANQLAEQTAARRKGLVTELGANLKRGLSDFEQKRNALGARILPEQEQVLSRYGADLSGLNQNQVTANQVAARGFREQQFRNVPELQRAVRESLGGSGLYNTGAARTALAAPTLDAARSSRDFETGLETSRLQDEVRRKEGFAQTGFNVRSKAVADRLGLDEETLNFLTEAGREDLINEAADLGAIESDLGSARLSALSLGQIQAMNQARADAQRKAAVLSTLGQGGGIIAGGFAPGNKALNIGLGSQIGQQIGNAAGGGNPQGIDPTLLYALLQQRPTFAPSNTTESNFHRDYIRSLTSRR